MEKKVESWGKVGPLRRVFPWQKWLRPALTPGSATVQAFPWDGQALWLGSPTEEHDLNSKTRVDLEGANSWTHSSLLGTESFLKGIPEQNISMSDLVYPLYFTDPVLCVGLGWIPSMVPVWISSWGETQKWEKEGRITGSGSLGAIIRTHFSLFYCPF